MANFCINCAAPLDPGVKFCASCGAPVVASGPSPPPPPTVETSTFTPISAPSPPAAAVARRYPALRIVAIVLKVAAVLWLIIGIITAVTIGSGPFGAVGGAYSLMGLLVSVYFAVMSWAAAELLHVFMDIEENTRRAAEK